MNVMAADPRQSNEAEFHFSEQRSFPRNAIAARAGPRFVERK